MKTALYTKLILVFLTIHLISCEKNDPLPGDAKELVLNEKSAMVLDAGQEFAFELFREVCEANPDGNLMISPLSVSYALGMTLNGSAGTTLDAFRKVLHLEALTDQEVNESYRDLMGQLQDLDPRVEFSIANSIWYKEGYPVLQDFIDVNQEYFDAAVRELDFTDPASVDIINGWIEEKTNDLIRDMLDYIPSDAVMYLVNALYFNAKWKYEFDPEDTYEGLFNANSGPVDGVDYMTQEGNFNYHDGDGFMALELPYGDSAYSMLVLLPDEGIRPDGLTSVLDMNLLEGWFQQPSVRKVRVELPKFKYGFKNLLNDPLIELGLGVAFGGGADFSRILPGGGLYISRVIHQTFIDVMEEGTEAAAATIVELRETAVNMDFFRADRPFLYLIRENSSGSVIFMGRVDDPIYEE